MLDEFLWVERYRPRSIDETILPKVLKENLQAFVDRREIPNLLLSGPAGIGKTTVARAMLEEIEADYVVINGSMNGNIDTLRNEIMHFATSMSFTGQRKFVILDEADYLNANSTQPALRNFMEEYSRNCGFILTCNYASRIIAPLHSRCAEIVFNIPSEEATSLARQFLKRAQAILTDSQVTFDKAVLVQVIQKFFPDWRRVLNELQRYSATGSIDSGILTDFEEADLEKLLEFMRGKDYTSVRNWVASLGNNDHTAVYRKIYDTCSEYFSKNTIPAAVLILAKYQYQSAFAADQEINLSACIAELLIECEWA